MLASIALMCALIYLTWCNCRYVANHNAIRSLASFAFLGVSPKLKGAAFSALAALATPDLLDLNSVFGPSSPRAGYCAQPETEIHHPGLVTAELGVAAGARSTSATSRFYSSCSHKFVPTFASASDCTPIACHIWGELHEACSTLGGEHTRRLCDEPELLQGLRDDLTVEQRHQVPLSI